jgi:hypothetical protein
VGVRAIGGARISTAKWWPCTADPDAHEDTPPLVSEARTSDTADRDVIPAGVAGWTVLPKPIPMTQDAPPACCNVSPG